jgi:hypothetical protein
MAGNYVPDFLIRLRDTASTGDDDLLTLVLAVSGEARKDKQAKVAVAEHLWIRRSITGPASAAGPSSKSPTPGTPATSSARSSPRVRRPARDPSRSGWNAGGAIGELSHEIAAGNLIPTARFEPAHENEIVRLPAASDQLARHQQGGIASVHLI